MYPRAITNHNQIETAWNSYMHRGTIPEGVLRSDIADSWLRCGRQIDPSEANDILPFEEVRKKRERNRTLIEVTQPL